MLLLMEGENSPLNDIFLTRQRRLTWSGVAKHNEWENLCEIQSEKVSPRMEIEIPWSICISVALQLATVH
jgi:hypothetical protein